jgi:malate permease and related proteins
MSQILMLLGKIFPAYGYVLGGYFIKKITSLQEKTVANFLFFVLIPLTVFKGALLSDIGRFFGLACLAFVTSVVMAMVSRFFRYRYSDYVSFGVLACLFSYFNIGWFGIPIVQAIFGDEGAAVMTALYVGGMFFGNTIGYSLATIKNRSIWESAKKLAQVPALYAVSIAFFLRIVGWANFFTETSYFINVLIIGTMLTSVCGMALVGMSVAGVKLQEIPWRAVFELLAARLLLSSIVISTFSLTLYARHLITLMEVKVYILLIALPIAANLLVFVTKDRQVSGFVGTVLLMSTVMSFPLILTLLSILGRC